MAARIAAVYCVVSGLKINIDNNANTKIFEQENNKEDKTNKNGIHYDDIKEKWYQDAYPIKRNIIIKEAIQDLILSLFAIDFVQEIEDHVNIEEWDSFWCNLQTTKRKHF